MSSKDSSASSPKIDEGMASQKPFPDHKNNKESSPIRQDKSGEKSNKSDKSTNGSGSSVGGSSNSDEKSNNSDGSKKSNNSWFGGLNKKP